MFEIGPDQRLQDLKTLHVSLPQQDDVMRKIDDLRRNGRGGEGESAHCMFLVGPTRSGKTRTVKMYIAEATKHLRAQGSSREPIIYASLTSECTPKNLNEILLQELKHPEPRKGTHCELTMRASQALIRRNVQLIVIDEMQHLTRLTSKSVAYKAGLFSVRE